MEACSHLAAQFKMRGDEMLSFGSGRQDGRLCERQYRSFWNWAIGVASKLCLLLTV